MTQVKTIICSLIILIFILSCGAKKETIDTAQLPSWAITAPQSLTHYYGVGKARRSGYPDQYIKKAEQNALQDLAQQITVTIESASILYQFEFQNNTDDVFINRLKLSSNQIFEGYSVKSQFQDDLYYWTLIELSKSEYKRLKALRKQNTLKKAYNDYLNGQLLKNTFDIYNSLQQFTSILETLKPYWGESTLFETDSESIDLAAQTINEIQSILDNLYINASVKKINVARHGAIDSNQELGILSYDNTPLEGFPLTLAISGTLVQNETIWTREQGIIYATPVKVSSQKNTEKLEVMYAPQQIINQLTKDLTLRKLLKQQAPMSQGFETELNIISPTLNFNLNHNSKRLISSNLKNEVLQFFKSQNIDSTRFDYSHKLDIFIAEFTPFKFEINTQITNNNEQVLYFNNRILEVDQMIYKTKSDVTQNVLRSIERVELHQALKTIFKL